MCRDLKELEMAKKRDHKVMITDEAINKVPRIEYKCIPDTEYDNIQELAKSVLEISQKENDSNEVAITYTLEHQKCILNNEDYLGVALGAEHDVDPLSNTVANHLITQVGDCVIIIMHNHPSLSDFSLSDVQFFLQYARVKMMVVVTNLGSITYLVKNEKYDNMQAVELFNEAVDMHNKANNLKDLQDAADHFLKNSYKCGITYDNR